MLTFLSAAAAGAAEAKSGLPQLHVPDFAPQLIWLALSFGLLYLLMSRVALPRVAEVIDERRDRIERDLEAAGRLKTETEAALASYEQTLAEARSRASAVAKESRDKLTAEVERDRRATEQDIQARIADAEQRIAATKQRALISVDDIAADTATAIVGRLLGEDASVDEVRQALRPAAAE